MSSTFLSSKYSSRSSMSEDIDSFNGEALVRLPNADPRTGRLSPTERRRDGDLADTAAPFSPMKLEGGEGAKAEQIARLAHPSRMAKEVAADRRFIT
eukprot:2283716-Rhodomonas_salina.2